MSTVSRSIDSLNTTLTRSVPCSLPCRTTSYRGIPLRQKTYATNAASIRVARRPAALLRLDAGSLGELPQHVDFPAGGGRHFGRAVADRRAQAKLEHPLRELGRAQHLDR